MYIEPNEEMILFGMDWGLSEEEAERGYDVFDFDQTGLLEINRWDCVFCGTGIDKYDDVTDEDCARHAEQTGFCKIIPVDELPPIMIYDGNDVRYYGWVDTEENRKNINEFFAN